MKRGSKRGEEEEGKEGRFQIRKTPQNRTLNFLKNHDNTGFLRKVLMFPNF